MMAFQRCLVCRRDGLHHKQNHLRGGLPAFLMSECGIPCEPFSLLIVLAAGWIVQFVPLVSGNYSSSDGP